MFKLPDSPHPTAKDDIDELADFIEYQSFIHKLKHNENIISINSVLKPILIVNDETKIAGADDESDDFNIQIDDLVKQLTRREKACNQRYPFSIENLGYTVRLKQEDLYYWIYIYLLLSTRLNMNIYGAAFEIDGTKILEKLSAIIAKNYFGDRAESIAFGTATPGTFETKINDLISLIGEGSYYRNRDKGLPNFTKDDKLDVVVWKHFVDKRFSKMIGFGQCKTGTSWDDRSTIELQPHTFVEKWFADTPIVTPIKMFFCSRYFPLEYYTKTKNAGLVFDRMRILDYMPETIDDELFNEIKSWCQKTIEDLFAPKAPVTKKAASEKKVKKKK